MNTKNITPTTYLLACLDVAHRPHANLKLVVAVAGNLVLAYFEVGSAAVVDKTRIVTAHPLMVSIDLGIVFLSPSR